NQRLNFRTQQLELVSARRVRLRQGAHAAADRAHPVAQVGAYQAAHQAQLSAELRRLPEPRSPATRAVQQAHDAPERRSSVLGAGEILQRESGRLEADVSLNVAIELGLGVGLRVHAEALRQEEVSVHLVAVLG